MRVRLYKKTKDNLSYFQFLSDDDQAILNSQGYADKDVRNNGVRSVITNASNAGSYERKASDDGKNFFILKAANGQEVARSVEFDDAAAMEAAIIVCIREIPGLATEQEGESQTRVEGSPYTGQEGDDNYKPLAFYQERIKGVENGFDSFATDEGSFYFTLNTGGRIILISEAYTSQGGRDNGTNSVTRNLPNPDRYQKMVHSNGKHYFNLLAGNNQQIATSVWFDSEAEMEAAIRAVQTGGFGAVEEVILKEAGEGVPGEIEGMSGYRAAIDIAAAPTPREVEPKPKKKKKKREPKEKSTEEKVYLKSGTYLFNEVKYQTMRSGNGKYYFSFRTNEGKALFFNANVQGFETEEEVDAAVARVLELGPYEGNYEGKATRNGKYYFYLKDTDGKSVGKSFFYDTPEEMQDAVGLLIGRTRIVAAAEPAGIVASQGVKDDYLPCERYAGEAGFHRFFNGDDESWYFAYNDQNGNTILRSEGYKSESARDNGIESVKKNSPIEDRWVKKQTDDGQYYFSLRAGNNQEIARTCYHESEDVLLGVLRSAVGPLYTPPPKVREALAPLVVVDDYLPCEAYAGEAGYHRFEKDGQYYFSYNDKDGNTILRSEGYKSESARDNGIESVKKNSPIEDRWVKKQTDDGQYYFSLRAGNNQEIAVTCYHESEDALLGVLRSAVGPLYTPPPKVREALAPLVVVDDYLPCEAYAGEAGYHRFEKDGQYYFSYNDQNGNTILRSEGYKSESARDNGIESVKKNSPIEDRWVKKQTDDGQFYFSLRAGNNQEIARTCYHESEDALLGVLRSAVGPLYTPPPKVRAVLPPLIVDDYLPCEVYAGEAKDGFRRFTKDGEWYFSYNDKNGKPILRSEGYKSEAARENGIESVKKNLPIKERWVKDKTTDGKYYYALRAANNQEIARSCYHENEGAMLAAWGLLPALFMLPAVAKAAPVPPPPVVEKPKAAVPPPPPKAVVAPPPPVAASSGGFKWWWLLPLLLLIPLLFMLMRGCDGCKSTPPARESVVVPPPPVPVDTVVKEEVVVEKPVPPATPVCACKGSENAIFNIPTGATPKSLRRLGTNPEFGNSHGLDAKGFYDKLNGRYQKSGTDKRFLDDLFKAMGYANGFADAKADMFSEAMVPAGTIGNMGYSPQHRTTYAQLNADSDKDRMAFRIKAANGCDIHFMKTCGNHFFFCPN